MYAFQTDVLLPLFYYSRRKSQRRSGSWNSRHQFRNENRNGKEVRERNRVLSFCFRKTGAGRQDEQKEIEIIINKPNQKKQHKQNMGDDKRGIEIVARHAHKLWRNGNLIQFSVFHKNAIEIKNVVMRKNKYIKMHIKRIRDYLNTIDDSLLPAWFTVFHSVIGY